MIDFQRLDLKDRQTVYECFCGECRQGCEYSFVNLYLWGRQRFAWIDGYFTVFSHYFGKSMYLYPAGHGPLRPVLEKLELDARERGIPFRMTAMTAEDCRVVEEAMPGHFVFVPDRDGSDYLYEIDHLAELKGKHYQPKRNHINRFLEAVPNWRTEEIGHGNLELCRKLLSDWYTAHAISDPDMDYHMEQRAADRALSHYAALELDGLILFDGDEPLALTMGSHLCCEVFDVHFEKALGKVQGDYPMINRTFARYIREKYPRIRYLNREDDMGLPGLRKAKLSYHPDKMVEQYVCFGREEFYGG